MTPSTPSDHYQVACLGPAGTFSETAALRWMAQAPQAHGDHRGGVWLAPTIAAAATAAASRAAEYGVLPVRNTLVGPVAATRRAIQQHPELRLVDHLDVSIQLVLASAGDTLDNVSHLYTHPVAYRQVERPLAHLLPQARVVLATSTSAAAAAAAQDPCSAAVCSPPTADQYRLTVYGCPLTPPGNATTFHVFTGGGANGDRAAA